MLQRQFKETTIKSPLKMEIWDNPVLSGFLFQQYRSLDESKILPYEALAILKNADGTKLANNIFFDELREMNPEMQVAVDRFLVPLALKTAAEKKRLPVAVNVHVATLCDRDFMNTIMDTMEKHGLERENVLFEIVEPHVPSPEQLKCLETLSSRFNPEKGFVLIVDDHDFKTGKERLRLLAPLCEMVKIEMNQAAEGFAALKKEYPHLAVVLERVTFNERDNVFALYPGVTVQGL